VTMRHRNSGYVLLSLSVPINIEANLKLQMFQKTTMDHAGHPAPTGNSAHNNAANPKGTNLSAATSSFMAANGSPFTAIDDMVPAGVRVPDPQTTERTCTTTITARLNIPVVANAANDQGRLLLIMNADPLSQTPFWVSRVNAEDVATKTDTPVDAFYYNEAESGFAVHSFDHCDPTSWGQIWDKIGMADFFAQTYTLGQLSQKHRVVGAAMRVNVGVDTTIARGSIESGQFDWDDTRYGIRPQSITWATQANRTGFWNATGTGNTGVAEDQANAKKQKGIGSLLQSCSYEVGSRVIRGARTQDYGTLDADKGASVRWTDANNFNFKNTINRNVVLPSASFYTNGVTSFGDKTAIVEKGAYDITTRGCHHSRGNIANITQETNPCRLAVKYAYLGDPTTSQFQAYFAADADLELELTSGSVPDTTTPAVIFGNGTFDDLGVDGEDNFNRGLYCNVTGVATNQWVSVDLVYHIEYIPKAWALTRGIYPPIDMQFDMIASMLGDPKQFPIVVQGNSFFSSLWRGIKKAVDKGADLVGTAGSAIAGTVGMIDPRMAMIGSAMSGGAAAYKRMRHS